MGRKKVLGMGRVSVSRSEGRMDLSLLRCKGIGRVSQAGEVKGSPRIWRAIQLVSKRTRCQELDKPHP